MHGSAEPFTRRRLLASLAALPVAAALGGCSVVSDRPTGPLADRIIGTVSTSGMLTVSPPAVTDA